MSTYIHYSTGFLSDNVQTLLDTRTEISSILYSRPEKCCQKTFLHDIACEEVIGRPQVLSEKKFYGRYFHSLVVHAPIQHRIVCLRSTNTEQQERHFNAFSSISAAISSRRLGEIITPGTLECKLRLSLRRASSETQWKSKSLDLGSWHAVCLKHKTPSYHTESYLSTYMHFKHILKK